MGIAFRLPGAAVPEHHGAAAVLALRDDALEAPVLERVVLHVHREALVGGIEARSLRHRPALEHALELESEVVVQPRGGVLLDHEYSITARTFGDGRRGRALGLGGPREATLAPVLPQRAVGGAAHGLSPSRSPPGGGWS